MAEHVDGPDASSIKPVSSLRSRFENLGKDAEQKPPSPVERRQVSLTVEKPAPNGHSRTSDGKRSPSPSPTPASAVPSDQPLPFLRKRRLSPPRPRPESMVSVMPSQMSPPMVTVDSPRSPGRNGSIGMRLGSPMQPLTPNSTSGSPTRGHARTLSRNPTASLEKRMSAFLQQCEPPKLDLSNPPKPADVKQEAQSAKVPPPVNRTAKPNVPTKPVSLAQKPTGLTLPEPSAAELTDHSASPFSTPPLSGDSSPERRKDSRPDHTRHSSDASFVERLRSDSGASSARYRDRGDSDASFVQRLRGDSDVSFVERARATSHSSFAEPSSLPDSVFHAPPVHHHVAARREQQSNRLSRTPTMPARYRPTHARETSLDGSVSEDKPRLPARPELLMRSGRTSPTKPRSGRTSPSKLSQQVPAQRSADGLRRAATMSEQPSQRIPASKPPQRAALNLGFDRSFPPTLGRSPAPAVPAPRRSADMRRPNMLPPVQTNGHSRDDEEEVETPSGQAAGLSEYPDSSRASRRPPRYRQRPHQIPTDYDTRLLAVCGEYAITTGYLTKAWNLRTGEQLLNMAHNENVKVTSVVFKPTASTEDEGKRIWLGTNIGEIHEVDIPSQSLIKTKSNAHARREIIRMFRHASELWTLDDSGELNVWKPDHKGLPSLDSQYRNFRVQLNLHRERSPCFSIVCGQYLWIATGKDIRVFNPSARSDAEFPVLRNALSQPGTGDVTSGAMISSKPELVYFGHTDGKVSIYNHQDCSCVGVVNVSMYKISSLTGVGEYLWAGYNTGMAYVYDTSTTPWRVKKDWQAHDKQICSIVADASALWKMDRLQVVTLGTDNMLRLWDGLLEEDWLDSRMQEHDSEYCSFRQITAAVLTWNAGASKPNYLQQTKEDNNFFREYMTSGESPDIFVFGFQELVDLEDKKTTAKAFFKSKKKGKTDGSEQEHMSHQYRAWRDHLTRCLEDHMTTDQPYTLLHTASLVGLFTCIFVKSSERSRIKHIHTAEVKRGMGGLHGNKGALIMRLLLDDSSICFVNCHLAAGQTQTIHRNNDVAAILEAEALPPYPLSNGSTAQHSDVFTSGGDGSMILDHEICILNGDLNYRIDTMGRDTVVKHVQQNNLGRLLERDQLLLSRKRNPGFRLRAFQESPITFAPTYKYNLHSDEYDTSEKRRAPAWCDRILYRGLGKVKMEEYRRWEVRVSDHRPVSGRLRLRVKTVDAGRRERVWQVCQEEFEQARRKVARAVQLQYLITVLGLSAEEAKSALTG
ncbi:hypothetical protein LTR85_007207 [Meristemomyces frigidus]|nr:hypothetical protein LTR85_007207 [Meristemomyces frigidus]